MLSPVLDLLDQAREAVGPVAIGDPSIDEGLDVFQPFDLDSARLPGIDEVVDQPRVMRGPATAGYKNYSCGGCIGVARRLSSLRRLKGRAMSKLPDRHSEEAESKKGLDTVPQPRQ